MQSKFCRTCGQANIPQVTSCAKCGAKLEAEKPSRPTNPFDIPNPAGKDEPPPTIAVNADSFKIPSPNQPKKNPPAVRQSPPKEKSNKTLWIIGGIGGILVLLLGVVAIAGVGGFLYFNSGSDSEIVRENDLTDDDDDERKTNEDDNTEEDDDEKVDKKIKLPRISSDRDEKQTSGKYTADQLKTFIEENKKRVGKYKLNNVKPMENENYFPNKDAGITAFYENGSKRVLHNISMFSDVEKARTDYKDYVEIVEQTDTKILSNKKESLVYRLEGVFFLVFCNDGGGCHQIAAKTDKIAMEYFNSYFKK